jgi:hypothetical protein
MRGSTPDKNAPRLFKKADVKTNQERKRRANVKRSFVNMTSGSEAPTFQALLDRQLLEFRLRLRVD